MLATLPWGVTAGLSERDAPAVALTVVVQFAESELAAHFLEVGHCDWCGVKPKICVELLRPDADTLRGAGFDVAIEPATVRRELGVCTPV
jgi:hypothetical protein